MRQSAVQLDNFYNRRLGVAVRDMAARRLGTLWPDMQGKSLLGFGFCAPFLDPYTPQAKRVVLAMPGAQGAVAHRSRRGVNACLIDEDYMPFADASFDYVLVAHGVEETSNLSALLAELWRVTRPEGRIVIVAPNRAGLWARSDKSPFGAGRPFSRLQLCHALSDAGFVPTIWSGALYIPPVERLAMPRLTRAFERFGETVWPGISGLILVEGIKRLYAEPGNLMRQRLKRSGFVTSPIGNTATPRIYVESNG